MHARWRCCRDCSFSCSRCRGFRASAGRDYLAQLGAEWDGGHESQSPYPKSPAHTFLTATLGPQARAGAIRITAAAGDPRRRTTIAQLYIPPRLANGLLASCAGTALRLSSLSRDDLHLPGRLISATAP